MYTYKENIHLIRVALFKLGSTFSKMERVFILQYNKNFSIYQDTI